MCVCVCVCGHERAGSFTPQKTTRSLQVALWKIVSSRGKVSWLWVCVDTYLCQQASNHLRSPISPIATPLTSCGSPCPSAKCTSQGSLTEVYWPSPSFERSARWPKARPLFTGLVWSERKWHRDIKGCKVTSVEFSQQNQLELWSSWLRFIVSIEKLIIYDILFLIW